VNLTVFEIVTAGRKTSMVATGTHCCGAHHGSGRDGYTGYACLLADSVTGGYPGENTGASAGIELSVGDFCQQFKLLDVTVPVLEREYSTTPALFKM